MLEFIVIGTNKKKEKIGHKPAQGRTLEAQWTVVCIKNMFYL